MKRRRWKAQTVPVSFFAFQDIITALAGVLIITVLAVLCQRQFTLPDRTTDGMNAVPQKQYEYLQERVALQQKILQEKHRTLEQLRAGSGQYIRQQNILRRARLLEQKKQQLESAVSDYTARLQKVDSELAALEKKVKNADPQVREKLEKITQYRQLQKDYLDKCNRLRINNVPDRKNIILDCSGDRWFWQSNEKKIDLCKAGIPGVEALENLRRNLRQYAPESIRLIIAVRPSAGGFVNALKMRLKSDFPQLEVLLEPMLHDDLGGLEL